MSDIRLFRQALAISSGSMSYLIDCTRYEIIDVVQREFCFFCLRNPEFETWKDAWKAFAKTNHEKGYIYEEKETTHQQAKDGQPQSQTASRRRA